MVEDSRELFTAPWLLASAVFVFVVALIEKALNVVGGSIPLTNVYPRQLLEWAAVLLIFDIALTLRHILEIQRGGPRGR
jgi:hypothetical protein